MNIFFPSTDKFIGIAWLKEFYWQNLCNVIFLQVFWLLNVDMFECYVVLFDCCMFDCYVCMLQATTQDKFLKALVEENEHLKTEKMMAGRRCPVIPVQHTNIIITLLIM